MEYLLGKRIGEYERPYVVYIKRTMGETVNLYGRYRVILYTYFVNFRSSLLVNLLACLCIKGTYPIGKAIGLAYSYGKFFFEGEDDEMKVSEGDLKRSWLVF